MQAGKIILIIIAFSDFRDEEYFVPKEIFKNVGFEVKTASTRDGTAIGSEGGEAEVNLTLSEVDINEYEAAVFVGGQGAHRHLDDPEFHKIAQDAIKSQKVLAAICIAPAILAKAGVLRSKKATVWSSALDKSAVKILKENGAIYQPSSVVQDGNIITANGPAAATDFGNEVVKALTQ